MTFECFIFVGYIPDINSGGNSTIPIIIKHINKTCNKPVAYFYILFNDHMTIEERYLASLLYQKEFVPIATPDMIMNKDNIVIYPENCGNPLNFKNVARINYYFNINESMGNDEYMIFYSPPYKMLFNKTREELGIKKITLQNKQIYPKYINFFYNLPELLDVCYDYGNSREGSCFIVRKGAMPCPHLNTSFNKHPTDAYLIPHESSNLHQLVRIFNKYKYFYSYDGFTTISQMASLCGCISIIIPFSDYKNISDFTDTPWYLNGIAYGDSIEQINHAINTTNKCRGALMSHAKADYDYLFKNMIDSIYLYFYPNDLV